MERLVVKNFGPIASADIDVRQFTLLVGHVSSGKSTIAKLLAIFNSIDLYRIPTGNHERFAKLLKDYNIDFPFRNNTIIQYVNEYYKWVISPEGFETTFEYSDIFNAIYGHHRTPNLIDFIIDLSNRHPVLAEILGDELHVADDLKRSGHRDYGFSGPWRSRIINELYKGGLSVYIPAERNLFSILEGNVFSFLNADVSIPNSLAEFGNLYEVAKNSTTTFTIPFLKDICINFAEIVSYDDDEPKKKESYITLADGEIITFRQASSGFQSLIPLFSVFQYWGKANSYVIIEEPESNLFPTVQKNLVEYIAGIINNEKSRCVITTHSPYILSSFDALVQAGNASEKNREETAKITPPERWIKYDDISCYFFDDKGNVTYAKNDELKNIGSEVIDGVSDTINDEYDRLLNITYS